MNRSWTNLELFFEDEGGRAGNFSFTDPWDGTVYPSCSFGSDDLALEFEDLARGQDASDGEGEPELACWCFHNSQRARRRCIR